MKLALRLALMSALIATTALAVASMATAATAPAPTGFFSGNINSCSSGDMSVEAVLGVTRTVERSQLGELARDPGVRRRAHRHDQQRHHRRWPARVRLVVEPSGRPRGRQAGLGRCVLAL